jgi:hypothetical protein
VALADSAVQQAQEELKAQGYYFGQIDGDKNADNHRRDPAVSNSQRLASNRRVE